MKRATLAVTTFTLLAAMAGFAQSNGQKSFDTMKSLTGNWEGKDSQGGRSRFLIALPAAAQPS